MAHVRHFWTLGPLLAVAAACGDAVAPPRGGENFLIGAGDIGNCDESGDEATARLLDRIGGTIFTAGDNAYPDGSSDDYTDCYQAAWGRHKERTRPSPGNHEYETSGAADYFEYFGSLAGPAGRGYYSYDVADWHIISLNSNVGVGPGSAQHDWLVADLAASSALCTLAYWHHPRFSSGEHGNSSNMEPLWEALYAAGADVIISAHDHSYERFAPQQPDGTSDRERGIRQFVVGTGGTNLRGFDDPEPNSEVRSSTHGVLALELLNDSYRWQFVPVAGKRFHDQGTGSCH